jgi:cell wall-associated NlpC family hydrolase
MKFLTAWQRAEGGHTNNKASWNWLNTTKDGPGALRDINSVGVTAFDNPAHGIQATRDTLLNGRYGDIVAALREGNPYGGNVAAGLSTWVSGSPTGNLGYAQKILGMNVKGADIKVRAAQAYEASPAKIVNSPSPREMAALKQQEVGALLQMSQNFIGGDFAANNQAMTALFQARQGLRQASTQLAQAEAQARQYGGTVAPAGPPGSGRTFDNVGNKTVQAILKAADAQVGKPYVWGAESPKEGGFDCSGLIDWAYRQAGIKLPGRLTTYSAAKMGVSVKGKPLQPGDWLITNGGQHMVMYVGNGQVIAAPRTGEVVQYQPVARFQGDIVDIRRVLK